MNKIHWISFLLSVMFCWCKVASLPSLTAHVCGAHHWHCSHPQNHVIILRLARRHPPCPLCSRPAACPPPWGGRPACPGWRWWTGAGKRSLRRCWWRASGPSRLWRSPPAPPWRREGRKRRERGLRSKVKRLMPRSVCMAQSAACGGRNNAPPVDTCAY